MATELATGYVRLLPSARGFQTAIEKELGGELNRAGERMGDDTSKSFGRKFSGGMTRVAKGAALGFAAAFTGAAVIGKQSIDAASDLEETQNKVNVVFGEGADVINAWAKDSSRAIGQSRRQALDAAGSFGNLFTQLGITSEEAAGMSTQMVTLASDFASFHNADITEVLQAQQAAFRGEYDSVQKFVPTINAAAVEQKALEMGLAATSKELDAQDKALATQALLMEGAGQASGDFARTSDGLANQQRILSAQFEDTKARIGAALIPAMTSIVNVISEKVVPWVQELAEKWMPYLKAGFEAVSTWVRDNWPQIRDTVSTVFESVKSVIQSVVDTIRAVWENFGDQLSAIANSKFGLVISMFKNGFETLRGIFEVISGIFTGDWSKVWDGLKRIFGAVWDSIKTILSDALTTIKNVLSAAWEVIGSAFRAAWEGIVNFFTDKVTGPIRRAVEALSGTIGRAFETAVDAVQGAWDKLKDIVKVPINAVIGFYNSGIRGVWNNVISKIPGVGNLPEVSRLAKGGFVPGHGNRDTVPAMLTPGEFVVTKDAAKKLGPGVLTLLNKGGTLDPGIFGYAAGGFVRTAEEVAAWTRQHAGKRYRFPDVGPDTFDCSGLTSAVLNYALGAANPFRRRHSSGSAIGDPALTKGLGEPLGLSFGARPPYMINSVGASVGHIAGTVNGMNFEATPPAVRVGAGARGASNGMFTQFMHLAGFGGLTDEDKGIVGWLRALKDLVTPNFGGPPIGDLLTNLFKGFPGMVYDFLTSKLPGMIVDAITDTAVSVFKAITPFADGGAVRRHGPILVGERGPEIFHANRGDFVQPLNGSTAGIGGPVIGTLVNNRRDLTPTDLAQMVRMAQLATV